jgi:hypothetical protein
MSHEFSSDSLGSDLHRAESGDASKWLAEVPVRLEHLPDGRESLVAGDPERCKHFSHKQGIENDLGYTEDCGLVSCEDILRQFGIEATENDVVHHAKDHGECDTSEKDPSFNGGTTMEQQVQILADYGVPAHMENQESVEDLASFIEQGHGVIAEVNAGWLWEDPTHYGNGNANHAIVITGVAKDPVTGNIQGFYINDSGSGESAQFVDVEKMKLAWNAPDGSGPGECVVTDTVLT